MTTPCLVCGADAVWAQARLAEMPPVNGIRWYKPLGATYLHENGALCDVSYAEVVPLAVQTSARLR